MYDLRQCVTQKKTQAPKRKGLANWTATARRVKAKLSGRDRSTVKGFCTAKVTDSATNRQPTKREMIFTSNSSDKELIRKELAKLSNNQANNPVGENGDRA